MAFSSLYQGVLARYEGWLDLPPYTKPITLLEGNTPLIPLPSLSEELGGGFDLYLKYEGLNPTGSFKDRGMTMAVSKAVEEGARAVICASTGNTSASAAAYAAKAGLKAVVLIPEGKIALGKLSQAVMYGAEVVQIKGNFDQALEIVREIGAEYPITIVNSINPYRLQGQKTAAFEICYQLGNRAPDYHFIPVGNAGNITAYWMGYKEFYEAGIVDSKPKMCGWQAAGAAPIVLGHPVKNPETIATAIRIGNPASWKGAVNAAEESGGFIDMVTDEEILQAYKLVARTEGIFCEPASAASIAGVIKSAKEKQLFKEGDTVVCTLTGHGLKDPDTAISMGVKPITLPADKNEIVKALGF
jgi:threonine synthase